MSYSIFIYNCVEFRRHNVFIMKEYIDSQQNVMKEARMLADLKRAAEEQSKIEIAILIISVLIDSN